MGSGVGGERAADAPTTDYFILCVYVYLYGPESGILSRSKVSISPHVSNGIIIIIFIIVVFVAHKIWTFHLSKKVKEKVKQKGKKKGGEEGKRIGKRSWCLSEQSSLILSFLFFLAFHVFMSFFPFNQITLPFDL